MNKDKIKSLQIVLDTFGPVVEALPEVINALTQKAKAEQHLKKLQSDCDALVDQFNSAQAQWQEEEILHRHKLAAISEDAFARQTKEKEALEKIQAKVREANKKFEIIESNIAGEELAAKDRIAVAQAQANDAISKLNERVIEHTAKVEAEIKSIDKRLEDAQKKLEALKAKL